VARLKSCPDERQRRALGTIDIYIVTGSIPGLRSWVGSGDSFLGGRRGLVLLEFAPIVVGMEDGVEKSMPRRQAKNPAADGASDLLEGGREHGYAVHVEVTSSVIGFIGARVDSENCATRSPAKTFHGHGLVQISAFQTYERLCRT
jgi:hypothetical protein